MDADDRVSASRGKTCHAQLGWVRAAISAEAIGEVSSSR